MIRRDYGSYASTHPYTTCPKCEGPKAKQAKFCRGCAPAAKKADPSNHGTCESCGEPTKKYGRGIVAQRCWSCELLRRRNKPVRTCSVDGCDNVHMAKGCCRTHYRSTPEALLVRNARYAERKTRAGGQLIQWLKTMPCQICRYSLMKCEAARLTPGGPYRPGNVMALCVRCHREVDAGITPAVTPPTSDEILEWAASKKLS